MSKLEKLLPPPMRRPPKPGQAANGNGAVALREDGRTDDPGRRAGAAAKDAPADLVGWVDERMAGSSFLTSHKSTSAYKTPSSLNMKNV